MPIKDLVVLVADKNIEYAIRGLLTRQQSLNIRNIDAVIHVHLDRDPGCRLDCHNFLRPFTQQYHYALVMFDLEGCGKGDKVKVEHDVENKLRSSGWDKRAVTIIFDPELEIWVWSNSKKVDSVLGWKHQKPSLREWLRDEKFLRNAQIKPNRPKEALEATLRKAQKPRSSSLYEELAKKVSLEGCSDDAFGKLKLTLQKWFPLS